MSTSNPRFEKVRFTGWPPLKADRGLLQSMPNDFRVKDPAKAPGAAVEMIDKLFRDMASATGSGLEND